MIIKASLTGERDDLLKNEIVKCISKEMPECTIYKYQPQTGFIVNFAIDWQIVSRVSDCIALASALWFAYENILMKKKDKISKTIFIQLGNEKDKTDQFRIGNEINSKDILIERFTEYYKKVKYSEEDKIKEIESIEKTGCWIKIEDKKP
jgi:hypothetical protein